MTSLLSETSVVEGVPKYVIVHRKKVGSKAKGYATVRSRKPLTAKDVDEMVTNEMEKVGARRFRQGSEKKGLDGFYYRKVFRGSEVVECPVLKELELETGETLRRKAEDRKVRRFDEKQ